MTEFTRSTALPHLEARRSCQENSCYRPHTHDAFSIGLIDSGTSEFVGPLNGGVRLCAGDVIVIPREHVHQCNPLDGSWKYQMIHMNQDWAIALINPTRAASLFAGVTVLRRPNLYDRVNAWSELIFAHADAIQIEAGLRELADHIGEASQEYVVASDTDAALQLQLRPVMVRLREDEANPSLDELAELIGLTKYQLVRAVKRATGLAPLAWRQNARIAKARHMLRNGIPITDTAYALGFTDQSHFHRVFRVHVAASPGTYRA